MHAFFSLFMIKGWEISLALRYLRTKRKDGGIAVIAIISFVGIMLAVFALISVLSIMNGFREELMSRILAFNGHAYVFGKPVSDFEKRDTLIPNLLKVDGVKSAIAQIDSPGLAQGPSGQTALGYMRGIDPKDLAKKPLIMENILPGGSAQDFGKGDYGGNQVLVGEGLATTLSLVAGSEITLMSPGGASAFGTAPRRKTYEVAGVFKSGVSLIDSSFIYMPLTQAQLFFDREDEWDAVEIMVKDPYQIAKYHTPLRQAAGEGALVEDWAQRNASTWSALKIERAAMRLILFFIVIIATMNIVSGIVMLVKNKTRDVAILRTMGAQRQAISRVFFLCGSLIGISGTFAGLALGVLFCTFIRQIQAALEWIFNTKVFDPNVYYLSYVPARMEIGEVAFVTIASILAAMVSTIFPALWASKLEPVEALRYE